MPKLRKFKFAKLVRDKIVPDMLKNGVQVNYHKLSQPDFREALKQKLIEETAEIPKATDAELIKELADIQEIIDALLAAYGLSETDLAQAQQSKLAKAGGYNERTYIEDVQISDKDAYFEYYLANPDQYPEITQ